jgi:hypothetical protein
MVRVMQQYHGFPTVLLKISSNNNDSSVFVKFILLTGTVLSNFIENDSSYIENDSSSDGIFYDMQLPLILQLR